MIVHRIRTTEVEDDRAYWECDCGCGGTTAVWNVDIASDKHVNYDEGDRRIDVHGGDYP